MERAENDVFSASFLYLKLLIRAQTHSESI